MNKLIKEIYYNNKPQINEEEDTNLMTDTGQEYEIILFNDSHSISVL